MLRDGLAVESLVLDLPVVILWSPGVSRGLARCLIVEAALPLLGLDAGSRRITNHCRMCGSSEHGQPALTPVTPGPSCHLSFSYAEEITVVALTRAGPVGVDVERKDAASFAGFDAVVGHEMEASCEQHTESVTWVRKESLLKATGRGLTVDPRKVRLTQPDKAPELLAWDESDPPCDPAWLYDLDLTGEHVAAVTVLARVRPPLVVKRVDPAALTERATGERKARDRV